MGTCPSKPGGDAVMPKANVVLKMNVGPKVNAGPKKNNANAGPRANAAPKANNSQSSENKEKRMEFLEKLNISTIMDIKELEKRRKELENFVMRFEMSGELGRGGELDNTRANFKNKIEKINEQIEGIQNGTLKPVSTNITPEPSAPALPNASAPSEAPSEDPGQVGGKRRRRTMKRKSRRQVK